MLCFSSRLLYSPAQVRDRDRQAIEGHGVPGYTLMNRAGQAAVDVLRQRWPGARSLLVLCGAGNNAGDGFVVARLAAAAGLDVLAVPLFDPDKLRGDARRAFEAFTAAGGRLGAWDAAAPTRVDLIVDGIFGTGLARPVEGVPAAVVGAVNASGVPVLALDVPSGLSAATGEVQGCALRAAATVTFVGRKIGLYLADGPTFTGDVHFDDLGTGELLGAGEYVAELIDPGLPSRLLPPRRRDSHKGSHGHVLVVGGDEGMSGAARLAGEAALYAGAGLVSVATSPAHAGWLNSGRPELMCRGVRGADDLAPLLARADVVVAGPGLGTGPWARALLAAVLAHPAPRVLDADALNLLAAGAGGDPALRRAFEVATAPSVITPHPGEAARLLGIATHEVQADRLDAVRRLVQASGAVAVLKGAGTLVGAGDAAPLLCDRGNPGMAAGGMGDVLAGVIGSLLAQASGAAPAAVAAAAVLVHARAGDAAVRRLGVQRGLLASDLFDELRREVNAAPAEAGTRESGR